MARREDEVMNKAFEWQALLADGGLSEDERRTLSAWLAADPRHRAAFEQARRFWDGLGRLDRSAMDPDFFRASARERFRALLWRALRAVARCTPRPLPTAAALAGACVLLLAVFWNPASSPLLSEPGGSVYRASVGQLRSVDLDDGSRITLGADTTVNVRFGPESRSVEMGPGEAYFKVAKDASRPFTVSSGNLRVTVHGTAFDVRRTAQSASVAVTEGVVSVSLADQPDAAGADRKKVLTAGERLTVLADDARLRVAPVRPESVAAWRNNLLVYNDAPLSDIVADMNRYRKTPVRVPDDTVARIRVTATFNSDDIDGMLAALSELFPLRLEHREDETVIVRAR